MQQFLVDIKTMRYDITAAVCRWHDSNTGINDPLSYLHLDSIIQFKGEWASENCGNRCGRWGLRELN